MRPSWSGGARIARIVRRAEGRSMTRSEVLRVAGLNRATLDHLVRSHAFPVPLPPRHSSWLAADVEAWVAAHARRDDGDGA